MERGLQATCEKCLLGKTARLGACRPNSGIPPIKGKHVLQAQGLRQLVGGAAEFAVSLGHGRNIGAERSGKSVDSGHTKQVHVNGFLHAKAQARSDAQ